MSNLVEHAKRELEAINAFTEEGDFYGGMTGNAVMELVKVFAEQGHSGMSAPIVIDLFSKVANWKPLKPITCEDSEWGTGADKFQNKRCSAVFKEGKDGKPYYIHAIVFKTPNGCTWGGSAKTPDGETIRSSQYINLPFTPKTFVIDVEEKEIAKDDWEFTIKDMKQLEEVFKYYNKKAI